MTEIGDSNLHGQKLVQRTSEGGNHPFARKWVVECGVCKQVYGVNSCDFHDRRCTCQGGKIGLPAETVDA